jgi:hypothetical protein
MFPLAFPRLGFANPRTDYVKVVLDLALSA